MANVTITLDDELLRRARVRAAEQGTSVNAVIRAQLQDWLARNRSQAAAVTSLVRRSESARSRRGDRRWVREDLHER